MFHRRIIPLLVVICLFTLAACGNQATPTDSVSTLGSAAQSGGTSNTAANNSANGSSMDAAQRTAGDFLNAWVANDYDTMYSLLEVNSHDAYSAADFKQNYTDAEKTITLLTGGKSYTLTNAIAQGGTADIAYDMKFNTRQFGEFIDSGRLLHLLNTAGGWRISWSQNDVFDGLKDGGQLNVDETFPNRGNIYDRDGNVIADQNGIAIQVTLHTKTYPTNNPDGCFAALANVFPIRTADTMKTLFGDRTGRDFAYEIGEISQEKFVGVQASLEQLCTLSYQSVPTRRYVAGGLAPHIVGYVGRIPAEQIDDYTQRGYPPDALVGIDGIEHFWEDTLAGHGAATLTLNKPDGTSRVLAKQDGQAPQSVYLTIDRPLQQAVQDMLKDAFAHSSWGAYSTGAAALVMDVHTGELLAVASYPDFNVDAFNPNSALPNAQELINQWAKDPMKPTFNRATLGQYPLGSVFKIVAMAAAADSGNFTLNTLYTCTGVWNGTPLGDRTRYDWIAETAQGEHGTINLKQALTGSCDTYFWNVGWTLNKVDPEILVNYAKRMGFGAPTGIRDVAESTGGLPDPANYEKLTGQKWRGSDALNLVIGQGDVLVTPLQVVRMLAAVANGGTLYQPLLVKKVGIIGSPSYEAKPIPNGQFNVSPDIIAGIQEAMCKVTTDPTLGTAEFVFRGFKGAVVCGKTGTAQAGGPTDPPHAWFGAFAGRTAQTPDIAIIVVVEHSNEGSYISAPIVRRIVETYYDLPITAWPPWWDGGLPAVSSGD